MVSSWVAESFGVSDTEYHKAYSREMIRQARMAAKGLTPFEEDIEPVWF